MEGQTVYGLALDRKMDFRERTKGETFILCLRF